MTGTSLGERRGAARGVTAAVLGLAMLLTTAVVGRPALGAPAGQRADAVGTDGAVIAHGVAALPADEVAWRVVADTAEPPGVAEARERALGFALATNDPVLVEDLGAGTQDRLAPGAAAFVAEGAEQRRGGLGGDAVPYYRIALVPTGQAGETAGDELILAGEGFAAPEGLRAIELTRFGLGAGETGELGAGAGDAPALVLVVSGTVEVTGDGATATLGGGEAAAVDGAPTLTAGEDGDAVVVVGTIGEPVAPLDGTGTGTGAEAGAGEDDAAGGATPDAATPGAGDEEGEASAPTPVATAEPGDPASITATAYDCTDGDPEDVATCAPVEGLVVLATTVTGNASSQTGGTTDADGQIAFPRTVEARQVVEVGDGAPEGTEALVPRYEFAAGDPAADVAFVFVPTQDPATPDTDGDGLTDAEEAELGTSRTTPDTDGDGLGDGDEVAAGTRPLDDDTDEDGIGDGFEISGVGTDPLVADSDGDGLPDGGEYYPGPDGYQANPFVVDSDGDGVGDGAEVAAGTDPLVPDAPTQTPAA